MSGHRSSTDVARLRDDDLMAALRRLAARHGLAVSIEERGGQVVVQVVDGSAQPVVFGRPNRACAISAARYYLERTGRG